MAHTMSAGSILEHFSHGHCDPADVDKTIRFVDMLHEKGIIVLSYYPFIFTKPLIEKHPDWMIGMLAVSYTHLTLPTIYSV